MMNKKKRIIELEEQILVLKKAVEEKNSKIEILESRIKGDRNCSHLCQRCEHAINYPVFNAQTGTYTHFSCELDNKCRDYRSVNWYDKS